LCRQPDIKAKEKRGKCALYLNIERELILTKCGPHIFPYFFSESSWCQQHGIEEKKRQKDHMPFDRKLSVSVDHDRVRFSLL
jgi:hypothetical protein